MSENLLERCSPESVGITSASLLSLIELAKQRNLKMHSLMVLRHGKVAAEMWWKPYAADIPHHMYSFSKSVTATAVGFAAAEGLLSLDDRVASFFPRRIRADADDRIYSVTVRHLLTMTSGMVTANESTMNKHIDWVDWILNTHLDSFPGEKFTYNSLNTYLLSAILRKVTKTGLTEYLTERLFEPLGIKTPQWQKCPVGIEVGGWGLKLTSEDMAKFTLLYLRDGMWNGKRILPEGWASEATRCQTDTTTDPKFYDHPDSVAGYGYHFWVNRDGSFRADGMYGQYGLALAKQDAVIITTAGAPNQMKVLDLLWDSVIPCIGSIPDGSEPGEDYRMLCERAAGLEIPRQEFCSREPEREAEITGRTYRFEQNYVSLLPLAVRYLHDLPVLGLNTLKLDFTESGCRILCTEGDYENNLEFVPDGEYSENTVSLGRESFRMAVRGGWLSDGRFEIDLLPIEHPHMQKLFLQFDGDKVDLDFDEEPPLEDSVKSVIDLIRVMRPISSQLARLAGKLITPLVTGTADPE